MTRLRYPLKAALRDDPDEASLHRVWQEIDARVSPRGRRSRSFGAAFPALAAAAAVCAAAMVLVTTVRRSDPGPLRLGDGRSFGALEGTPGSAAAVALSDGSFIELARDARLEPLETSGSTFSAVLARGSATFDVRPGGPRRWTIECGLATVEVVGTRFGCVRGPGRLRVSVERGTVLVRGERVPDRVRRLGAGEILEIVESASAPPLAGTPSNAAPGGAGPRAAASASPAARVAAAPSTAPTLGPSPAATRGLAAPGDEPPAAGAALQTERRRIERAAPPVAATAAARAGGWRDLARDGRHRDAFRLLGAEGVRREARRLDVEDLLTIADVARLSGHPFAAVSPLERILVEFARDPQASLAAFALGRLELDALGRPARAAKAFERALALGVPADLREDARARLVEAHARAGDRAAAAAAAVAYRNEFPAGRLATAIQRWLSGP